MAERDLDRLLRPKSVVLIGAEPRPRSIGGVLARNLFSGEFAGPILPIHPSLPALRGVLAFRSVADLPLTPDLAVIAAPAAEVPALIAALGSRGTAAAVVLSAGFGTPDGAARAALREAAAASGIRLVGPACLGLILPGLGLNASIAHTAPRRGDLAFIAQSDSLAAIFLDAVADAEIGFSLIASLGDTADVDFADLLDWLAYDPNTRAVLLAVDSIGDVRRFMSAARTVARVKPVIVFDGGRLAHAAAADPAALRRDRVADAAFRRAGLLPVPLISDLAAAAGTLSTGTRVPGDRLAVICNGRGAGVMAADLWATAGGRLAHLDPATIARLDQALPAGWGQGNPINVFADAPAERHAQALAAVLADSGTDAVITVICPTAIGDTGKVAAALAEGRGRERRKPVAAAWLDAGSREKAAPVLAEARIARHPSPRMAVSAFAQLIAFQRNQEMLIETPPSAPDLFTRDVVRARAVLTAARAAGRSRLADGEAAALLAAYGLELRPSLGAGTAAEAIAAADRLGYPVALTVRTEPPTAAEATLVALELEDAPAVEAACGRLARQVAAAAPEAAIAAWLVQSTEGLGDAHALHLGLATDPAFGPVIAFGQGGNAAWTFADQGYGLPPLNLSLAETLMAESRVWRELEGAGDRPPAAIPAIALTLVRLSQIATDLPEVAALDLNPVLADAAEVVVLAARVEIAAADGRALPPLAIRPYPVELEKTIVTRAGKSLLLRPIRPEDEPALQALVRAMSPEDIRLRFFSPMKELDHRLAARLTQIDYDREMALVAIDPEASSVETQMWGVMRVSADAANRRAEYAGAVRSSLKGQGLGRVLLEEIIAYSRGRGTAEIWGEVLAENKAMLALVRKLGFSLERDTDDPAVIHVRKPLTGAAAA